MYEIDTVGFITGYLFKYKLPSSQTAEALLILSSSRGPLRLRTDYGSRFKKKRKKEKKKEFGSLVSGRCPAHVTLQISLVKPYNKLCKRCDVIKLD